MDSPTPSPGTTAPRWTGVVIVAAGVLAALSLAPSRDAGGTGEASPGPRIDEHGRMTTPRAAHQATALGDGRVLITGGCGDPGCERMLASAEVYDPVDGSFRTVAPMSRARGSHEATALPDGRVLVTGGWTPDGPTHVAEIYDPESDRWTPGPARSVTRGRAAPMMPILR